MATPSRSPILTPSSSVGVHTSTLGRGGLCLKPSSALSRSSSVTAAECSPGSSVGANDSAISLAFRLPSATGPAIRQHRAAEHRGLAQPEFGVPLASMRPQTPHRVKLRATEASDRIVAQQNSFHLLRIAPDPAADQKPAAVQHPLHHRFERLLRRLVVERLPPDALRPRRHAGAVPATEQLVGLLEVGCLPHLAIRHRDADLPPRSDVVFPRQRVIAAQIALHRLVRDGAPRPKQIQQPLHAKASLIEIQLLIAHDPREIVAVQFFFQLGVANLHQPQPLQALANVGGDYELVQRCRHPAVAAAVPAHHGNSAP